MKLATPLQIRERVAEAPQTTGAQAPVERRPTGSPEPFAALASLDAAERLAALNKAFPPSEPEAISPSHVQAAAGRVKRIWQQQHRRVLKSAIGLLVVALVGWMPVRTLLETTSTEAVINARLITLRAPIEGQVGPLTAAVVGTEVPPGAGLLDIANPRAERGRLDDLRRLVNELEGEIKTLIVRRSQLVSLQGELAAQTRAFRVARLDQLEARIAELTSDIAGAEARREEADEALVRARRLDEVGTGTKVALEKARRDASVAAQALLSLVHRKAALAIELSALRKDGVYVGDSYNDRPQSLQRADDIALRLNELNADVEQRQVRLSLARTELADEERRYAARAGANLVSPVRGSIWEVLTAPGETVVRGQDLVRVLDCSGLVVTATVGETAYNHLRIGEPARFRFRGESHDFEGRIIGLTGVAAAAANLAIQPSALAKEPYRVTVALPELAKPGACNVGRTGRVTFEK
jgi:multidrug resistance efflux pump